MLDRLEKAGLVRRERNPNDRRSVLVHVNARKMQKIHAQYAGINERLEAFLSETPEAELQLVATFLSKLNALRQDRLPE